MAAQWTQPDLFLLKANLNRRHNNFNNGTAWTSPHYCTQCSSGGSKDFGSWRVLVHFLPLLLKCQPLCSWEVCRVHVSPRHKWQKSAILPQAKQVTPWREDEKQLKAVISLRCHDWKCKKISEHGFRLTSHSSYNFRHQKGRIELWSCITGVGSQT